MNGGMRELALFAGAGGGILGGHLLGWRTICAVERDPYAASVLCARQNDGSLPPFPIWDDVCTFDGRPWRGLVDVVSGGFPCQDISSAGKGAGIAGERSGLWKEMARIVCEVRPRFVFVENSSMLTSRGLGTVLGDLAALGYDARWGVLGAIDAGAPHKRDRIWIVASDSDSDSKHDVPINAEMESTSEPVSNTDSYDCHADRSRLEIGQGKPSNTRTERAAAIRADWWISEPDVGRVANGVAARVDRLKAIGNGQVPAVAALAWRALTGGG